MLEHHAARVDLHDIADQEVEEETAHIYSTRQNT
jgi:hypothetical protein